MKEQIQMNDSMSFSQALKNIKCTSITTLNSSRSWKEVPISRQFNRTNSPNFFSSKPNFVKRTNVTLKTILCEHKLFPQNEYVLRLQYPFELKNQKTNFDDWIEKNNSGLKNIQIQYLETTNYQFESKKSLLKQQIRQNIQKINQFYSGKQKKDGENINSQQLKHQNLEEIKYSFANQTPENRQNNHQCFRFDQKISRFLEINSNCIDQSPEMKKTIAFKQTKDVFIATTRGEECSLGESNKQNYRNNSYMPTEAVKGLEFSKKRRFKSTKKMRTKK